MNIREFMKLNETEDCVRCESIYLKKFNNLARFEIVDICLFRKGWSMCP